MANIRKKKVTQPASNTELNLPRNKLSLINKFKIDSPFFPQESPFSKNQKLWISGFLEGLKQNSEKNAVKETNSQKTQINFLYGTQTGNAENLARDTAGLAAKNNFETELASLDDVTMETLQGMKNVVFIISTYGEGEMPDNAQLFWESLASETAPKLNDMKYGVLALGDTSYEQFCNAGKLIDFRLEQLGATRLIDRVDCDVDFEVPSKKWIKCLLPLLNNNELVIEEPRSDANLVVWNRKNPYFAEVSENKLLSGKNSNKEIRHYEIELSDSGIDYNVGDTLNIVPQNCPKLVNLILKRIGVEKNFKPIGFKNSINYLLLNNYEISTPNLSFVEEINLILKNKQLDSLLKAKDKDKLESFLWGKDILDLLNLNEKVEITPEKFLSLLKALQPRAYSISSSPKVHGSQVHLTISSVKWSESGRTHEGVCSNYLAKILPSSSKVGVFISPNNSFRLPDDDTSPIIMIGPGTGLAPFKAFLEERKARGATGKNWLFFGDQTRENDFIYKKEITDFQNSRLLNKLDLAFSRDQKDKVYVQHKMKDASNEIFKWLEQGAYIYVCGDAKYMAKDVDNTLFEIVKKEGGFNDDQTKDYINNFKREKRYLRDVY